MVRACCGPIRGVAPAGTPVCPHVTRHATAVNIGIIDKAMRGRGVRPPAARRDARRPLVTRHATAVNIGIIDKAMRGRAVRTPIYCWS
jgi:hypothetical protein